MNDYKQYKLRNTMTKMYRNYYAHWTDLDILFSFLAIAGLFIALGDYKRTFEVLHIPGSEEKTDFNEGVLSYFNTILTALTIICGFLRQRMRSYWNHYRKPFSLLKVITTNTRKDDQGKLIYLEADKSNNFKKAFS